MNNLNVVTNQLPYNAFWRAIEDDIKPFCIENNIGIICYSTLAQGLLTGRYKNVSEVPEGVSRSRLFSRTTSSLCRHNDDGCEDELFDAIDKIINFSNEQNMQPATIATTWLKKQSGVLSLLIGARNSKEVQLNVNSFDYEIDDAIIDKISHDYIEFLPENNKLMDGAIEILEYLKPKYRLFIITNGFRDVQDKKLKNSKIKHYFEAIYDSESVGVKKPDPKIFKHALKDSGSNPKESLMVGDNYEADVLGAKKLRINTLHFVAHGAVSYTHLTLPTKA